MDAWMLVVWHLGAIHPVEKVLTLLLAFGPFVVLGLVLYLRRGEDDEPEDGPAGTPDSASSSDQPAR